jgi:pyruvate formate lyase activating enzyme
MNTLKVGGFVPFTTIDFPGENAACVVFCKGCPWRCPYCQNAKLQTDSNVDGTTSWAHVLSKRRDRQNFLTGVVFSGGEPLAQRELKDAIQDVRLLGFKVGLHTGGAYPEMLRELLCEQAGPSLLQEPLCEQAGQSLLLDWVGLDVKTGFDSYDALTDCAGSSDAVKKCLNLLIESGVAFECRTTVHPALVQPEQVFEIAEYLHQRGVKEYKLQRCYDTDRKPMHSPCFEPETIKTLQGLYPGIAERLM